MTYTQNPYYRAVILVLASDDKLVYRKFRNVYQQYIDWDPDIKILFVYGNSARFTPREYDLVYDIEENYYPGMITKTVEALRYINNNYEYDYLLRTNISTFWDLKRFKKRLDRLPSTRCVTGSMRRCVYKNQKSPDYASGVNLVMSRDMVDHIIDNRYEVCSWDLPEDWSLSKVFIDHGIQPKHSVPNPIHFMEKFTEVNEDAILREILEAQRLNHDHFRIKNKDRDNVDIGVAKILLREYYGKEIS